MPVDVETLEEKARSWKHMTPQRLIEIRMIAARYPTQLWHSDTVNSLLDHIEAIRKKGQSDD